jgi:hypothetical protein
LLVGVLVIVLVFQISVIQWHQRPVPLDGPLHGERFPEVLVSLVLPGEASAMVGGGPRDVCSLLVLFDPSCGICQAMRRTWPVRFRILNDSLQAPIPAFWITDADREAILSFSAGQELDDILVGGMWGSKTPSMEELGVFGTPITYLLDKDGRVRYGIAGPSLPPIDSVRAYCQ